MMSDKDRSNCNVAEHFRGKNLLWMFTESEFDKRINLRFIMRMRYSWF